MYTATTPPLLVLIGFGIGTVVLMLLIEGLLADLAKRKANGNAVLVAGLIGIAYFIGMLYAAGLVP